MKVIFNYCYTLLNMAWKERVKVKAAQLCSTLCDPMDCSLLRLLCPWNSPGKNTGVGGHSLLQGIFPTQGLNPGLPHCKRILYQLSHQGSPNMAWTYISKAQFSKAKQLRDMKARDRLAGLVPVMDSKVPAGDSPSERLPLGGTGPSYSLQGV